MDDEFAREVLRLAEGQTVEDFETDLKNQAQHLDIDIASLENTLKDKGQKATSSLTSSTHPRRSISTGSHGSHSTDFTDAQPRQIRLPSLFLQLRYLSHHLAISFHVLTILRMVSLTRVVTEKAYHHKRTEQIEVKENRFGRFNQRERIIKDSLNDENIPPTCCKRPIPGSLVASVMSQEEQDALMNMLVAWDDEATTTPPTIYESTSHPTSFPKSRSQSRSPTCGAQEHSPPEEMKRNLEIAMEQPGFKELRQHQERQRDNLTAWAARKRQGVIDGYAVRKLQLLPYFDRQKDQLAEKQSAAIARIEDKHVVDEHEMREGHEIETRNNAIALKHMEAYCRGETTSGERHDRAITDRDLAELTKARRARDQMDAKHSGAISVLRGEQSRRISQRLVKQEEELLELESRQMKELESLQRECDDMVRDWDEETQKRRSKLERWWTMQVEIWRKNLEQETGVQFSEDLPPIQWPLPDNNETIKRKDPTKRHTIAGSPAPGLQSHGSRELSSISPTRKHHRISTAFTIRSGMIGKA
ncbi:hypothetical protein D6C78_01918 [Aureobasidium pullulans]|uniref:Uncharacterized protein n=1 Tax=Aureobasidium pullulans TaxID=5580 RepID=A0A4T0C2T1_AURPU|nr:hypothetical protein D6C78_01918 [Aureobasidium pullulans]